VTFIFIMISYYRKMFELKQGKPSPFIKGQINGTMIAKYYESNSNRIDKQGLIQGIYNRVIIKVITLLHLYVCNNYTGNINAIFNIYSSLKQKCYLKNHDNDKF
jgi:hypothetical protein